jgi:hypothetical protein
VRIRVSPWLIFYLVLQFGSGCFDFSVAVLASSGFRREQTAPVNTYEIAVREFVSALRIRRVPFVDAEMPFCIFTESVQTDEFILFVYGRPMFAPRAFTVRYKMSLFDQVHCESKSIFV